jgi:predicted enzyme related to lactoylglutathione lyase
VINKIDVVFVHSKQFNKTVQWYKEVMRLKASYGDSHWQEYKLKEGPRFAIDAVRENAAGPENQSIIISFGTDDIYSEVGRLASLGVEFYPSLEKTIFDVGPAHVATFKDPEGNYVQLSQRKV